MNIELRIRKTDASQELVNFLNQPIARSPVLRDASSGKAITVWGSTIRHSTAETQGGSYRRDYIWKEKEEFFIYSALMPWRVPDIRFLVRLTAKGGLCEGQTIYLSYSGSRFSDDCGYDEVSKGYHLASWHANEDYPEFVERISGEVDRIQEYMNPRPYSGSCDCLRVKLPLNTDEVLGDFQLTPDGKAKEYYHQDQSTTRTVSGNSVAEIVNYELKCFYSVSDLAALSESFDWVARSLESMTYWRLRDKDLDLSEEEVNIKWSGKVEERIARKAAIRRINEAYNMRDESGLTHSSKKKPMDEELSWKKFLETMNESGDSAQKQGTNSSSVNSSNDGVAT